MVEFHWPWGWKQEVPGKIIPWKCLARVSGWGVRQEDPWGWSDKEDKGFSSAQRCASMLDIAGGLPTAEMTGQMEDWWTLFAWQVEIRFFFFFYMLKTSRRGMILGRHCRWEWGWLPKEIQSHDWKLGHIPDPEGFQWGWSLRVPWGVVERWLLNAGFSVELE